MGSRGRGWLALAVLAGLGYLHAQGQGWVWLALACKAVPVLALLAWLWPGRGLRYTRGILAGLGFSLLGDIALAWPADGFVAGLGSFLLAHLCYIAAYSGDSRQPGWPWLLLALAVAGPALAWLLLPGGAGPLWPAVVAYAAALAGMLWRAGARYAAIAGASGWLALAGASLFVLSDTLIGSQRFVMPGADFTVPIILSYWLAQWAIAASARYHPGATAMRQSGA